MIFLTKNKEATKYWSDRQENYIAKFIGGKTQPSSGSGKFKKSDVICDSFLIECKTAMEEKETFSIKKDWLDKIRIQSVMNHRPFWSLAFNFGARENDNYFIIDENTFLMLKELYEKHYNEFYE